MDGKEYGLLVRGITRNVNTYISASIKQYGIKEGQYEYFMHIYASPGINQLELARLKGVGKGSVTKALKILEDDGFIKREVDEKDRRNFRCFISKKGEKIVNDLIEVRMKSEKTLFKGMKQTDRIMFYRYLNILYKNSNDLLKILHKVNL